MQDEVGRFYDYGGRGGKVYKRTDGSYYETIPQNNFWYYVTLIVLGSIPVSVVYISFFAG